MNEFVNKMPIMVTIVYKCSQRYVLSNIPNSKSQHRNSIITIIIELSKPYLKFRHFVKQLVRIDTISNTTLTSLPKLKTNESENQKTNRKLKRIECEITHT